MANFRPHGVHIQSHLKWLYSKHIEGGYGRCPSCSGKGRAGVWCLPCCTGEGMVVESCFVCKEQGPVWEKCFNCIGGEYRPLHHGVCCDCGKVGPSFRPCISCKFGYYKGVCDMCRPFPCKQTFCCGTCDRGREDATARSKSRQQRVRIGQPLSSNRFADPPMDVKEQWIFNRRIDDNPDTSYCRRCFAKGPTGKWCIRCCCADGNQIGKCYLCRDLGPVWQPCTDCDKVKEVEDNNEGGQYQAWMRTYRPELHGICDTWEKGEGEYRPEFHGICGKCRAVGPSFRHCIDCGNGNYEGVCDNCGISGPPSYPQDCTKCNIGRFVQVQRECCNIRPKRCGQGASKVDQSDASPDLKLRAQPQVILRPQPQYELDQQGHIKFTYAIIHGKDWRVPISEQMEADRKRDERSVAATKEAANELKRQLGVLPPLQVTQHNSEHATLASSHWNTEPVAKRRNTGPYVRVVQANLAGRNQTVQPVPLAPYLDPNNPTVKFLPTTEASNIGTCPVCSRRGNVGWFCFKCCDEKGQLVGCCEGEEDLGCNRCGKTGEACVDCGGYQFYGDNVPFGKCITCNAEGRMYKKCILCKNNSTYEFFEKPESQS
jgi:hypothetical protein